ncbi:MAG: tyrosine-type recombinase/integrase [Arthrospira platensis]
MIDMAGTSIDLPPAVSGHVRLREGKRRGVWYAKWRDQTGQHQKRLGLDWTGKGPPPPGFLRERDADVLLDEILVDARRGQLRQKRTGVTFADVAEDWYARGPFERDWSASTQVDYRSVLDAHLLREFGARPIEAITTKQVEEWRDRLAKDGERSRKTINKILTQAHAIFQHAVERYGLIVNVASKVKRLREANGTTRFDFYSPEEIDQIVAVAARGAHHDPKRRAVSDRERALRAQDDKQDAAIYLTAALSGLRRSELLALLWDDIDFAQSSIRVWEAYSAKKKGKPKSRKARTVPMVDKVADALKDLKERGHHTGKGQLVFVSREGTPLDGSALRRRYIATLKAAGLRQLRFHDLRHTFGSLAINVASIVQVQAWMGHADIKTTMRYLHHKSRTDDAHLLSQAFQTAHT